MTTSDDQNPPTTPDAALAKIAPTWATGATYARDAIGATYPRDRPGSATPATPATPTTPTTPAAGATAMPGAPRRGVAVVPILLGLVALAVAATVASVEYDRQTAGRFVGAPLLAGFGGLLVLLAAVGMISARVSRSRRARGGDAPSA